jgi:HK97 family phage portal protein
VFAGIGQALDRKLLSPRITATIQAENAGGGAAKILTADDNEEKSALIDVYGKHAYAYATVFEIANAASGLKPKLMANTAGGESLEILPPHPVFDAIKPPNKWQSRADLWEMHFQSMELVGESYWELVPQRPELPPSPTNPVEQIYFLRPDRTTIVPHEKEYISHYEYMLNGKKTKIPREYVLYFRYIYIKNDHKGLGSIEPASNALETDLYCASWNLNFFKNGAVPEGMLVSKEPLSDQAFQRLKEQFTKEFTGWGKFRKPLVADGLEWKETTTSQRDMDFMQQRERNTNEILSTTGTPKLHVGLGEQINKATAEVEERLFWTKTMIPKLRKFEDALNQHFMPLFGPGLRIQHDLSQVDALKPDLVELRRSLKEATGMPFLAINEARRLYAEEAGQEFTEMDGGDVIYVPFGQIPLGTEIDDLDEEVIAEDDDEKSAALLLKKKLSSKRTATTTGGWPSKTKLKLKPVSSADFYADSSQTNGTK